NVSETVPIQFSLFFINCSTKYARGFDSKFLFMACLILFSYIFTKVPSSHLRDFSAEVIQSAKSAILGLLFNLVDLRLFSAPLIISQSPPKISECLSVKSDQKVHSSILRSGLILGRLMTRDLSNKSAFSAISSIPFKINGLCNLRKVSSSVV